MICEQTLSSRSSSLHRFLIHPFICPTTSSYYFTCFAIPLGDLIYFNSFFLSHSSLFLCSYSVPYEFLLLISPLSSKPPQCLPLSVLTSWSIPVLHSFTLSCVHLTPSQFQMPSQVAQKHHPTSHLTMLGWSLYQEACPLYNMSLEHLDILESKKTL